VGQTRPRAWLSPLRPALRASLRDDSHAAFTKKLEHGYAALPTTRCCDDPLSPGSSWSSLFGNITLDLREAQVAAPETVIDVRSVFGNVDLLVPEGINVVVEARSTFGQVQQDAGDDATPGAPRVIVRGGSTFGRVRIRNKRLHERLLPWLRR